MECYRDITFCGFYHECRSGSFCDRALTDDIKRDANNCGLPICSWMDKPKCFRKASK